jgi:3-oxoacyl-[acyl-carrier-protein] synthase III
MKTIAAKTGSESQILSVGSYRPKRVVLNDEVAIRIDSSDEWIQQRTGIESRRFADESESLLDMATWAVEDALKKAKLSITDIDTIIVATITFPFQAPSAATAILQRLGHPKAAAFDINAACAGFCTASRWRTTLLSREVPRLSWLWVRKRFQISQTLMTARQHLSLLMAQAQL